MMSSSHTKKNKEFIKRFIEVCESDEPTIISNYLNITYQAATNYLNGRCPNSKTLLKIAEITPYSIHWLLTGEGEKFVNQSQMNELDLLADNFKDIVDPKFLKAFVAFIDEFSSDDKQTSPASPKMVTLTPDKIREQKVEEKDIPDLPVNPS